MMTKTKMQRVPEDICAFIVSKKKYKRETFGDILRRLLKLKEEKRECKVEK